MLFQVLFQFFTFPGLLAARQWGEDIPIHHLGFGRITHLAYVGGVRGHVPTKIINRRGQIVDKEKFGGIAPEFIAIDINSANSKFLAVFDFRQLFFRWGEGMQQIFDNPGLSRYSSHRLTEILYAPAFTAQISIQFRFAKFIGRDQIAGHSDGKINGCRNSSIVEMQDDKGLIAQTKFCQLPVFVPSKTRARWVLSKLRRVRLLA